MNKILASAALLALLVVGRGATAAEAVGWITKLDRNADRIFLDDGRIFGVSEDINFASLTDRVRVVIHFDTIGGDKIATDISLAPDWKHGSGSPWFGKMSVPCGGGQEESLARKFHYSPRHVC